MRKKWLCLGALMAGGAFAQVVDGVDYRRNPALGQQALANLHHRLQEEQMRQIQAQQQPQTIIQDITVYVPNRFGAVSVNDDKGQVFMVSNRISREEAEAAARAECRKATGGTCRHFVSFGNECAAVAQGSHGTGKKRGFRLVLGSVHPDFIGMAEEDALQKCRAEGLQECGIIVPEECSFFPDRVGADVDTISLPNRFGAIAVKLEAPSAYGSSAGHVSREDAEAAALSACRREGQSGNCRIFVSYGNECAAMVEGLKRENGKKEPYLIYSTVPPERQGTAEDDALQKCTSRGHEECRVVMAEECSHYVHEPIRPVR